MHAARRPTTSVTNTRGRRIPTHVGTVGSGSIGGAAGADVEVAAEVSRGGSAAAFVVVARTATNVEIVLNSMLKLVLVDLFKRKYLFCGVEILSEGVDTG